MLSIYWKRYCQQPLLRTRLKLGLSQHVVDGIHSKEMEPERYLLKVISEFLNEVGSRPTWRVIVDALRSPVVRQHQLANEVEAAHFPDATAIREVVPEIAPTGKKARFPHAAQCSFVYIYQSQCLQKMIVQMMRSSQNQPLNSSLDLVRELIIF